MEDPEDGEADIYSDLPEFRYDETIDKLNAIIARLEAENKDLHSKLAEMKKEKEDLEKNIGVLGTNLSSLMKTARLEIQRKDRTIDDLRQELRSANSRWSNGVGKRHLEVSTCNNQSNDSRTRPRRDSQTCEPASKKRRLVESENEAKQVVSKREEPTTDSLNYRKPPIPSRPCQKENVPLSLTEKIPAVKSSDELSKKSAPSLPIIDCPTVFSARMYQRLYNKSTGQMASLLNSHSSPVSSEQIPSRIPDKDEKVDRPPKRDGSVESESHIPGSDAKLPCAPLRRENLSNPLNENISTVGGSQVDLVVNGSEVGAVVNNNEVPLSLNSGRVDETVTGILKEPLNTTTTISSPSESDLKTLEPPKNKCESANNDSSSKMPLERIHTGDPSTNMSIHADSADYRNGKDTKSLSALTTRSFRSSSTLRKSHPASAKKSKKAIETDSSEKLPHNPNSKSGRRKMFVPISSSWNCVKTSSEEALKSGVTRCTTREETTSLTTELTVQIDDGELNYRKNLLLDVFGSPVKWADEASSESGKSEVNLATSCKKDMFNIFGSPFKNGDSCSSEPHNFVLPPGAYEDSCCTTQHPDKVLPPKSPLVTVPDSTNKDKSSSASNLLDDGKTNFSLPPPVHPIKKKTKSLFSPVKDSKTGSSLPGLSVPDDRSSTGICFPFKPSNKYEDSVLGQFDDTAQFVSALAKVDTQISPFNTPPKTATTQSGKQIVDDKTENVPSPINNMTSFKEAFHNNVLTGTLTETTAISKSTSTFVAETCSSTKLHFASADTRKEVSGEPKKSQSIERTEGNFVENTATPSKLDSISSVSSSKFIHRSNFSSSSVFTISSDSQSFLDKPVNVLQPRKTPRTVNKAISNPPSSPCKDTKLIRRIAIPDAFITEQEERVRYWQKNHLHENTSIDVNFPKSPTKGLAKAQSSDSEPGNPETLLKPQDRSQVKKPLPCKADGSADVSRPKSPSDCTKVTASPAKPQKNVNVSSSEASSLVGSIIQTAREQVAATRNVELTKTETTKTLGTNYLSKEDFVPIVCVRRASELVTAISKLKTNVKQSSVSKVRVTSLLRPHINQANQKAHPISKVCNSSSNVTTNCDEAGAVQQPSTSSVASSSHELDSGVQQSSKVTSIIIKRKASERTCDFKRSSAFKNTSGTTTLDDRLKLANSRSPGNPVVSLNNLAKEGFRSNCKLIRRKSAPDMQVFSQINKPIVISNTPTTVFNAPPRWERKEDSDEPNLDNSVWVVHPIDIDRPRNLYKVITSSFSSLDPRAQPIYNEERNVSTDLNPTISPKAGVGIRSREEMRLTNENDDRIRLSSSRVSGQSVEDGNIYGSRENRRRLADTNAERMKLRSKQVSNRSPEGERVRNKSFEDRKSTKNVAERILLRTRHESGGIHYRNLKNKNTNREDRRGLVNKNAERMMLKSKQVPDRSPEGERVRNKSRGDSRSAKDDHAGITLGIRREPDRSPDGKLRSRSRGESRSAKDDHAWITLGTRREPDRSPDGKLRIRSRGESRSAKDDHAWITLGTRREPDRSPDGKLRIRSRGESRSAKDDHAGITLGTQREPDRSPGGKLRSRSREERRLTKEDIEKITLRSRKIMDESPEDEQGIANVRKTSSVERPEDFHLDVSAIKKTYVDNSNNGTLPVVTSTPLPKKIGMTVDKTVSANGVGLVVRSGLQGASTLVSESIPASSEFDQPARPITRSIKRNHIAETIHHTSSPRRPRTFINNPVETKTLECSMVPPEAHPSPQLPVQPPNLTTQPVLISRKNRAANFSAVTVNNTPSTPAIISRKRPASFSVKNSST